MVEEQAHLVTLRQHVEGKSRGSGGSGGASSPVSLKALDLEQDIREVAGTFYYEAGGRGGTDLAEMITYWWQHGDKEAACLWAEFWNRQIMNLDRDKTDLIGACPECGSFEFREREEGGEGFIAKPALTLYPTAAYAECKVCSAWWEGVDKLMDLAAYMNGQ